jgi:hypothetical protein
VPGGRSNLRPAQPGNVLALRHGAQSERQIGPRATREKRRILRQIGVRLSELDGVGKALVHNWSRAAAALALMDEYAAENGWLTPSGQPKGFARLYVSMLNSERLALKAMQEHLRIRQSDPSAALADYLASKRDYHRVNGDHD